MVLHTCNPNAWEAEARMSGSWRSAWATKQDLLPKEKNNNNKRKLIPVEWPGDVNLPVSLKLPKCRDDRHATTPALNTVLIGDNNSVCVWTC